VPYADVNRWELNSTIASGTRPALVGDMFNDVKLGLFHCFLESPLLKPTERATASSVVSMLENLLENDQVK